MKNKKDTAILAFFLGGIGAHRLKSKLALELNLTM
jgi:hypothetical protein